MPHHFVRHGNNLCINVLSILVFIFVVHITPGRAADSNSAYLLQDAVEIIQNLTGEDASAGVLFIDINDDDRTGMEEVLYLLGIVAGLQSTDSFFYLQSPSSYVLINASLPFETTLGDGVLSENLVWFVNGVEGGDADYGTIDENGVYTAPASPPANPSVMVSVLDTVSGLTIGRRITILANSTISMTPSFTLLLPDGEQQFTVTTDPPNQPIILSVNNQEGGNDVLGTINATGHYTAPFQIPAGDPDIEVEAAFRYAPGIAATAEVQLTGALSPVLVEPPNDRVALGARVPFQVEIGGAPVPATRWLVNGIVGGNPGVGTISDEGLYAAPGNLPNPPTKVTIRGETSLIPGGFVDTTFVLEELEASPGAVHTFQQGHQQAVTLTAHLSDGTNMNLTAAPGVTTSTDSALIATVSTPPAPKITVPGTTLGRTMVRFADSAALGDASAGVLVVADTDYTLVARSLVRTVYKRRVEPFQVFRRPTSGSTAGGLVDATDNPDLSFEVLEGTGYVDNDTSRDPSGYTAVLVPSRDELRFGDIPGYVHYRVTDQFTGRQAEFTAELVKLQLTAEVWGFNPADAVLFGKLSAALAPYPVLITPDGAAGVNGSATVVVRVTPSYPQTVPATAPIPPSNEELAVLLADARLHFHAPADMADFVPVGFDNLVRGQYIDETPADPSVLYKADNEAHAEGVVRVDTAVPDVALLPAGAYGVFVHNVAHGVAELLVRQPGALTVTVEIADTIHDACTVNLLGKIPWAADLIVDPPIDPLWGAAVQVDADFPREIFGLTPVVQFHGDSNQADVWDDAELVGATPPSQVSPAGGDGITSRSVTGFSAWFAAVSSPLVTTDTFHVRLRFAEFPDEPVRAAASSSLEFEAGQDSSGWYPPESFSITGGSTVQWLQSGVVDPLNICSNIASDVTLDFASYRFTRYPADGSAGQGSAVSFSVKSGGIQNGDTVVIPGNQCVELTPSLNVGLEPGDVILGGISADPPSHETALLPIAFGGAQLAVFPTVLLAPPNQAADLNITLRLKGTASFGRYLGPDSGTIDPTLDGIAILRDGKPAITVPGADATLTRTTEREVKLEFPLPATYFTSGLGEFRLRFDFSAGDDVRYWAGPVTVGSVILADPPSLLPLNATWPNEPESGRIPVSGTVADTTLPVHLRATLEQPGFADLPLVGFVRQPGGSPRAERVYVSQRDIWVAGGKPFSFPVFGDRSDTRDSDGTTEIPDGLPDRVSKTPDDLTYKVETSNRTDTTQELLSQTFTAFVFRGVHPIFRQPLMAPVADSMTPQQIFDLLSFTVDESKPPEEAAPVEPGSGWDVWLYVDNQINYPLNVAMVNMGYLGRSIDQPPEPDVLDGRWGDFGDEPVKMFPEKPAPVTGGNPLSPFGVMLGGVCFDPWTKGRANPNSTSLLGFLDTPPTLYTESGGFLYAQGGASGGGLDGERFLAVARTPGVDLPGLDCGYLEDNSISSLSKIFEDETVKLDGHGGLDTDDRSVEPFAERLDGKKEIRTVVHYGGGTADNAYFEITTDPALSDGSPLCRARLQGSLLLTRSPMEVTDAIQLTVRPDRKSYVTADNAKVAVAVISSAIAAAATASGPVGTAVSAGVAAAFQMADNAKISPFGATSGAFLSTSFSEAGEYVAQSGVDSYAKWWNRVSSPYTIRKRILAKAATLTEQGPEMLIRRSAIKAMENNALVVTSAELGAGLVSSLAASWINSHIDAEMFSTNHSARARIFDQLGLFLPPNALDTVDATGLRGAWLTRMKQPELDLERAVKLWKDIENKTAESPIAKVGKDGRSAPYYLEILPGFGPATVELAPGGVVRDADNDTVGHVADFHIKVDADPGNRTRFPFISTTVVEVGRSGSEATARAAVDASESSLRLRLFKATIESITVGATTWGTP